MNNIDPKSISTAARVSKYMMELSVQYKDRWDSVQPACIPYGDLAYGSALMSWYQSGCPKKAWFSYAITEQPCPYLMEFAKEISEKFGLPILLPKDGMEKEKEFSTIIRKNFYDWGLN